MKLLFENWRKYLNEIGEASIEPYPFELSHVMEGGATKKGWKVEYKFYSEKSVYKVLFKKQLDRWPGPRDPHINDWLGREEMWEIIYAAQVRTQGEYAAFSFSYETTGEGNPLKVMSTIVDIIKDFVKKPDLNQGVLTFHFTGTPKSGEDHYDHKETKRAKLYKIFLKKNMPQETKMMEPEGESSTVFFRIPKENENEANT